MTNTTFTVTGSAAAAFTVTEAAYADKGGLLEELATTLICDSSADWGALFALQTTKELVSVRACRGQAGTPPTVALDLGGGAGPGVLAMDGQAEHYAILVELSSEAPVTSDGPRVVKAAWQFVPDGVILA